MTTTVSRWGEGETPPSLVADNDPLFADLATSGSIDVECAPDAAWALVTDVGRIGELSPECIGAQWLDGASGPSVGARFEGTNRIAGDGFEYIWIRPCTVTEARPPHSFAYTVGDRYDGSPATEWRVEIDAVTGGCRITQRFRHVPNGRSGLRTLADADPASAA